MAIIPRDVAGGHPPSGISINGRDDGRPLNRAPPSRYAGSGYPPDDDDRQRESASPITLPLERLEKQAAFPGRNSVRTRSASTSPRPGPETLRRLRRSGMSRKGDGPASPAARGPSPATTHTTVSRRWQGTRLRGRSSWPRPFPITRRTEIFLPGGGLVAARLTTRPYFDTGCTFDSIETGSEPLPGPDFSSVTYDEARVGGRPWFELWRRSEAPRYSSFGDGRSTGSCRVFRVVGGEERPARCGCRSLPGTPPSGSPNQDPLVPGIG